MLVGLWRARASRIAGVVRLAVAAIGALLLCGRNKYGLASARPEHRHQHGGPAA